MTRPKGIAGKSFVLILISVILFILPGCWDRREIEDLALVMALGIDRTPQKGYVISVQIAIPSKLAGPNGPGEGPASLVTSVESDTILGAFNLINAYGARRITLMHARALVISEEAAKDRGVIKNIINPLARYREIRQNMSVIVVRGKASNFLKENQGNIETNPVRFMEGLTGATWYTAMVPLAMFYSFLDGIQNHGAEPFAILGASKLKPIEQDKPTNKPRTGASGYIAGALPREGGPKAELLGTAVFRMGRMVGELNGEETRIFNMIKGTFRRAFMPFTEPPPMEKFRVTHDIRQGSPPKITVKIINGIPIIQVKLSLEGELIGNQSGINYATDPKEQKKMEKHITSIIHTRALALIKKAQQEYNSDIFGFGNYARYDFLTWLEWDKYDWVKNFPKAEVHVSVDYRIRRVGLIFAQPETR